MYRIAAIPGDGVGPEQMKATLGVLDAVKGALGLDVDVVEVEAGDSCARRRGVPLPEDTVEAIKASHACLKAPVGETAVDVIVKLRQMFDLYANVRPIKSYPGVPCLKPGIDLVLVRENTEGVYKGIEFELPEAAVCLRVITRRSCERIARFAFDLAMGRRARRVTAVHKANVMKLTCGLFAKVCKEVARLYPEVTYDEMYVDAAAMRILREPEGFDVIVTTNLFGDILSEEAAQLVGGLGMSPGANIGDGYAIFEPVHGSAPDIAGRGIVNPCSLILAAKMMFEWLGERHRDAMCIKAARMIEEAVIEVLGKGIKTPDLGGRYGTYDVGRSIGTVIEGWSGG